MQHVGAHVGELAQLFEADHLDLFGVVDDARVAGEEAADVRPVFIQFGVDGARHDGAADVAAAARKGLDVPVRVGAVKAGDDGVLAGRKAFGDQGIRLFFVEGAVFFEEDDVLRVHEFPAEFGGDDAGVEVFAAGSGEIGALFQLDLALGLVQHRLDVEGGHAQLFHDGSEAAADSRKRGGTAARLRRRAVAFVQEVGHLDVVGKALAGRGDDGEPPGRVCAQDVCHARYVVAVRQRRTAEFTDDEFHW